MTWRGDCAHRLGLRNPDWSPVGGGCINQAWQVDDGARRVFVKHNPAPPPDFFRLEAEGLERLAGTSTVRIPAVIDREENWLALEWIETGPTTHACWEALGRDLAQLHRQTADSFGCHPSNYIGALPQDNGDCLTFAEFFWSRRIEPLIRSAPFVDDTLRRGFNGLEKHLDRIFDPSGRPSLIHGDLWSGNVSCGSDGSPVIYDPAVHYSHREIEIAFTSLFGGFDTVFYRAYDEAWPLDDGFDQRRDILNIYPLLVHVHLFGTSYLSGIRTALSRFS